MGLQPRLHMDRRTVSNTSLSALHRLIDYPSSNAHYPPHKHSGKTTHLILDGSLTMRYPNDTDSKKETLGVGERWDVDAQKVHEVWVGPSGCTYVIGE